MRKDWRNNGSNVFWYYEQGGDSTIGAKADDLRNRPGPKKRVARARVVHLPDAVVGNQKNWYRAEIRNSSGNWDHLGYNKHLYYAQVAVENTLKDIEEAAIRERNPTDIEFHPRRPLSGSAVFESDENFVNNNFKLCIALLKWIGGES